MKPKVLIKSLLQGQSDKGLQYLIRNNKGKFTLYALMDSFFWFDAINVGRSIVYTEGSQVIIST